MNLVLNTMREVGGPQYERLVRQAGLERFLTNPPADDWTPVASNEEVSHLFGVAYRMLGDKGIRLFFRNYGQRLIPFMMYFEPVQAAIAEFKSGAVPPARHVQWFVDTLVGISNSGWSPVNLTEDANAYYIEYLQCPLCGEIKDADSPICVGNDVYLRLMAQALIGRPLDVQEVACAATGDPGCKHRIPKQ
jgi:hypothetical protein